MRLPEYDPRKVRVDGSHVPEPVPEGQHFFSDRKEPMKVILPRPVAPSVIQQAMEALKAKAGDTWLKYGPDGYAHRMHRWRNKDEPSMLDQIRTFTDRNIR